ncbi:SPOR domain-containing protein [Flavobacterium sp. CYK-55]|uniref:SPOR domain-containing protein n=1 Tax=Flavobacterium sp. CYK-55 TaxID=2835529 RepID=UPI001BCCF4A0|nr:SPOR domain-containing protein [Flavobacterium sp. CYK-55]MBS7785903.1 SPOR domain-containing protein [Flavobacterium sp. CYK-55]
MKIKTTKRVILAVFFLAFTSKKICAQESNVTLSQDPKFEQLLSEKRKINSSLTITDRYKIQIYSGESEPAKKTLSDFRKEFKVYDGTIVFNTPVYKVWIGNFKTRIEAERNLNLLKKKFPNALLIRPNK